MPDSSIWTSHDARLSALEENQQEILHVSTRMESTLEQIVRSTHEIKDLVLSEKKQNDIFRHETNKRLESLEDIENARIKRWRWIQTAMAAVGLTAAGAFLSKVAESVWNWIKFGHG